MKSAAEYAPAPRPGAPGAAEWWGRERFLSGDGENAPCPEVIDVTGQRRYLLSGAFGVLEPGLWRVTAVLDVCPDAARRSFSVEFGAEPHYTNVYLPQRQPGRHEIDVEHVIGPGDKAQLRVYLVRAGFHGEFRFLGARLQRIGDAQAN